VIAGEFGIVNLPQLLFIKNPDSEVASGIQYLVKKLEPKLG
jgi:hypothetical protein